MPSHDHLPELRELAAEGGRGDGPAGLRTVLPGFKVAVPPTATRLRKVCPCCRGDGDISQGMVFSTANLYDKRGGGPVAIGVLSIDFAHFPP